MLISFVVTTKLICVFVFAYAKSRFSHNAAQIIVLLIHVAVWIGKLTIKGLAGPVSSVGCGSSLVVRSSKVFQMIFIEIGRGVE